MQDYFVSVCFFSQPADVIYSFFYNPVFLILVFFLNVNKNDKGIGCGFFKFICSAESTVLLNVLYQKSSVSLIASL